MTRPDHNPYESYAPKLAAESPPESEFGLALRRGDAKLRLAEMDRAEEGTLAEEARIAALPDRLDQINQRHAMGRQYLLQFGCRADERREFREILNAVSVDGSLSLHAAATLASTFHVQRQAIQCLLAQRNGSSDGGGGAGDSSGAVFG